MCFLLCCIARTQCSVSEWEWERELLCFMLRAKREDSAPRSYSIQTRSWGFQVIYIGYGEVRVGGLCIALLKDGQGNIVWELLRWIIAHSYVWTSICEFFTYYTAVGEWAWVVMVKESGGIMGLLWLFAGIFCIIHSCNTGLTKLISFYFLAGKYKTNVVYLCRTALKTNNINSFVKIMRTGEA